MATAAVPEMHGIDHAFALRSYRSRTCGDDENCREDPLESLSPYLLLTFRVSFQSGGGFAPARSRLSPRLAAVGGDLWPGVGSFLKGAGPRNDRALGDASPVPERPASGGRRDARAWRPARPDSRCVHLQPCLAPRVAPSLHVRASLASPTRLLATAPAVDIPRS
jgi:hypothetical protein